MTDIAPFTQAFQPENLSWDLGIPGRGGAGDRNGTLAVAAFTQAQHYANGYIPSGTVLALGTSGTYNGLLVPYLAAGSAGAATAVGILKATISVVQLNGALKTKVGVAYAVAYRTISQSKLPFTSGTAAAGGYLDSTAKTALPLLDFAA